MPIVSSTTCYSSQSCSAYSYKNLTCISKCPTGFTCSGTVVNTTASPYRVFYTDFNSHILFTSSVVGNFKTESNNFLTQGSPIPSKERGFYFQPNSSLVISSNYVPAPEFTFNLWIRTINPGTIFKINGTSDYLVLDIENGDYNLNMRLCGSGSTSIMYKNVSGNPVGTSTRLTLWENVYFQGAIISGTIMSFTVLIDYIHQVSRTLLSNSSITSDSENFVWRLGNPDNGFEGFVYRMNFYNGINGFFLTFVNPPMCNPNFYYENNACFACSNCLSLSPEWCVRSSCS